jgi:hypothetical protein
MSGAQQQTDGGVMPTHEIQQRLLKNVDALQQLAAAHARGDAAAVGALTASVNADLKVLADCADKQKKQQQQQQQQQQQK